MSNFQTIIIPQNLLYLAIIAKNHTVKDKKLTLTIIGPGSMAMAIAHGLKDSYTLEFVARDISKLKAIKKKFSANTYALKNFDITGKTILLAVKPYALGSVAGQIKGEALTVYSVLAGTTIEALKENIPAKNHIRIMPNVAAKFGASTSVLTGDISKKEEARTLFNSIGDTFWLDSEKEVDIATAVAGSGPALLTLVAEAMMDGLVKEGMKRPDAIGVTNSLFKGFAPLIASNHPALIKDSVMSPGGTTAAAYGALEEGAVRSSFIKAVGEAFKITQK
jgi:pyrroline-5-carboxylate reductase